MKVHCRIQTAKSVPGLLATIVGPYCKIIKLCFDTLDLWILEGKKAKIIIKSFNYSCLVHYAFQLGKNSHHFTTKNSKSLQKPLQLIVFVSLKAS